MFVSMYYTVIVVFYAVIVVYVTSKVSVNYHSGKTLVGFHVSTSSETQQNI